MNSNDPCCSAIETETEEAKKTIKQVNLRTWTSAGAIFSAMLSSACCWLPFALIVFGTSSGGVSGYFEEYRHYLLGATSILLSVSFYLVYFQKEECNTDGTCNSPNPKLITFNKVILWGATVTVLMFALFPNYIGYVIDEEPKESLSAAGEVTQIYEIEGMTCEACTLKVRDQIKKVSGVVSVHISYADKSAQVSLDRVSETTQEDILNAISTVGYRGQLKLETKSANKQFKAQQENSSCCSVNDNSKTTQ